MKAMTPIPGGETPIETGNGPHPAPISPLPGGGIERNQGEQELLTQAYRYVRDWVLRKQGSASEFIEALTQEFGSHIRMYACDLVGELLQDHSLPRIQRAYAETVLNFPEVEAALQHPHSIGSLEKNTLDELFARSAAVRSSQRFIEAIQFVSRLREYAPYNNMMVYLQRPNATFWATESHWEKKFNRQVKEDSIPIIMLQPKGPIMLAYDVADTVGPPLPARFREAFQVEGQFSESTLALTLENCKREGIGVKGKHLGMLHAGTAIRRARFAPISIHIIVEINDQLGPNARYATLCHELAHIYLGHLGSDSEGYWPARLGLNRHQRELEAEAVAYMVCRRTGLTTSSADYLAGYLSRPADLAGISVDMVTKVTGRIERMGRELIPLRRRQRQQSQSDLFGDQAQ